MIGINLNEKRMVSTRHFKPETVDTEFDIMVETLPDKDPNKRGMAATLFADANDNLYWKYSEIPPTDKERIDELELALADLMGGA